MNRSYVSLRFFLGSLTRISLLPATNRAQTPAEERPVGSLRSRDSARQCQIVENSELTSFDGLMLSFEQHGSPRLALRFGADLQLSTTNGDQRPDTGDPLVSSVSSQERTGNSKSLALKVQYAASSNPEGEAALLLSCGPEARLQPLARRAGLGVDRESNRSRASDSFTDLEDARSKFESAHAMLDLQYVRYPNPGRKLRIYGSCGPQVRFRRDDQEGAFNSYWDGGAISTGSFRTTSWGESYGAGRMVRWDPVRSFGLLAEYRTSAGASFGSSIRSRGSTHSDPVSEQAHRQDFQLNRLGRNFGLAVRF